MARHPLARDPRRPMLALLTLLLVAGTIAVPALAAPPGSDDGPKTYEAEVAPSAPCVGVATDFVLTLTNTSGQQQLGSANVASDLAVTEASLQDGATGTAVASSGVVELRDLALQPSESVAVTFTGTAEAEQTYPLDIVAKQANNFRGNPGNDLVLTNGPVEVIATTTDCTPTFAGLDFSVEPADAVVGTAVPGQDGPSPAVRLVDTNGETVQATGVEVTVTLLGGSTTEFSSGTTSVTTTSGVAIFDDLEIGSTGVGYTLRAQAGSVTEDSAAFNVYDVLCVAGERCASTTSRVGGVVASGSGMAGGSGGGLSLGIAATSGSDDCGTPEGYELTRIPGETTAVGVGLTDKVLTFQIDKKTDQLITNNGVSFYQVCATPQAPFTAFSTFTDRFGNPVRNPDDDHNEAVEGTTYATSGFLPDCTSSEGPPPCVLSRTKSKSGSPVITVLWGSGFRFG